MTLIPSVFSNQYPEKAESWTLEAYDPMMPLRGTLVLRGEYEFDAGEHITVNGEDFVVTASTIEKRGTSVTTTVVCRDHLYDILVATPATSITWLSAPERFIKPEILANIEMPVHTQLRTKIADTFGVGGWKMSEIIDEACASAGLEVSYNLPDFWVKQLTIDRFQPVLEFIQSVLNPFFPRIYIEDETVIIKPYASDGEASLSETGAEVISESTVYAEPYSQLRIWGGTAEFKRDKWEGKALLDDDAENLNIEINSIVGHISTHSQCGLRHYWQQSSDTHSLVRIHTVYSKDMFGNDAFLLYKEETKYTRKVPLMINSLGILNTVKDSMRTILDVGEAETAPSPDSYYLESRERFVNVYEAYGSEWEQPLLKETHHAIAKYLWWGNTSDVPDGDDAPEGFPSKITGAQYGIGDDDVVGCWSNDAFYEVTTYNYEYTAEDGAGMVGGLLLNRSTVSFGVGRALYDNMINTNPNDDSDPIWEKMNVPTFYMPAYLNDDRDPIAYNPDVDGMKFSTEIENFTEVSLRTVMRTRTKTYIDPEFLTWFDKSGNPVIVGNDNDTDYYTQYKVEGESALIPISEAPQQITRKRGMLCYQRDTGSGVRVVEINIPLIVSWDDLDSVAEEVKKIHSSVQSIRTKTVTTPGRIPINGAMLGGSYGGSKVIAGSYHASGTGEHYSSITVQGTV